MKSFAVFAMLLLSANAIAAGEDTCKKISAMAGSAMESRQNGDLVEDAMSTVGDKSDFSKAIVMKAYEAPVVEGTAAKKSAIAEFRNQAYLQCYSAHN